MSKKIVILASGTGSNFRAIAEAVKSGSIDASIRCLVTDRLCPAVDYAAKQGIDFYVVPRKNSAMLNIRVLSEILHGADLVVCAGYLSILPASLVAQLRGKIINIHPSLLPEFGGRGMYGLNVHKAVIAAGKRESGCTVHYVDAGIDTGQIIEQRYVNVDEWDTPEDLQQKVNEQELQLLPAIVQQLVKQEEAVKNKLN